MVFCPPALLCTALAVGWSVSRGQMQPPTKALMAAGALQGSYCPLAQRHAEQLARVEVNVELAYSDNQKDALR